MQKNNSGCLEIKVIVLFYDSYFCKTLSLYFLVLLET